MTIKPYWISDCGRATVYVGDNMCVMLHMKAEQFHSIVTDPPYGIEFMNREWDAPWKNEGTVKKHNAQVFQQWLYDRATQMLRCIKPGAHLLCFGGTRMYHRTTCAIEDAGFEIRDCIMWLYGNGFPKSMNVSNAIDKELGFFRERQSEKVDRKKGNFVNSQVVQGGYNHRAEWEEREPITDAAKQWDGWGTCLKPAYEPIVVARKEHIGTVASNTLEYGCGGMNVDGCRIGEEAMRCTQSSGSGKVISRSVAMENPKYEVIRVGSKVGRWPSNLIHDGCIDVITALPPDAQRFFYTPKADEDDRPHGRTGTVHPTVKPLDLMKYLVRLVCAKGGHVLDPFMGSGSTGCAAIEEGMWFTGIEQNQEYADIAVGRLKLSLKGVAPTKELETGKPKPRKGTSAPPSKKLRGT